MTDPSWYTRDECNDYKATCEACGERLQGSDHVRFAVNRKPTHDLFRPTEKRCSNLECPRSREWVPVNESCVKCRNEAVTHLHGSVAWGGGETTDVPFVFCPDHRDGGATA